MLLYQTASKRDQPEYRGLNSGMNMSGQCVTNLPLTFIFVSHTGNCPVVASGDELQRLSSPVDDYDSLFDVHLKDCTLMQRGRKYRTRCLVIL
jgi:hypothetical protein